MNGTLAPKSLGDILNETFTICKRNFLRLATIVSIVMVPAFVALFILSILLAPLTVETETGTPSPFILLVLIPIFLASLLASVLMVGAFIHAVAQQYFNQPVSISRAYKFAWRRLGAMLGAAILVGLALAGIYLVAILIAIAIITPTMGEASYFIESLFTFLAMFLIVGSIMILIAAPAIIYLTINWNFVSQTALLEGCGPVAALSRSWALVKGSWWRVLGIVLLLGLIAYIIYMIFYMPAMIGSTIWPITEAMNEATTGAMTGAETGLLTGIMIWAMLAALVGWIAYTMYFLFFTVGHTLLYFDLRVRKEGYSLDVMADELGLTSTSTDNAP